MPKLQLSFHGTFSLKKRDVIKILQAAREETGLQGGRQSLVERTGLGNEKVLRIVGWANRSGLIQNAHLSPEGQVVYHLDAPLKSVITDWLMHFYLSFGDHSLALPPNDPAEWGGWPYFVFSFLPQVGNFTLNDLVHQSSSVFNDEREKRLKENFSIVLRAYTDNEALASIRFITSIKDDWYGSGNPNIPGPHVVGYMLAKLWARDFGDATSVLTESVLNQQMGLAPILGIGKESLQSTLSELESLSIIEQRRTVPPYQIVRRWTSPLELLQSAYANQQGSSSF